METNTRGKGGREEGEKNILAVALCCHNDEGPLSQLLVVKAKDGERRGGGGVEREEARSRPRKENEMEY